MDRSVPDWLRWDTFTCWASSSSSSSVALSTLLGTSAREGGLSLLAVEPGRGLRLGPENLSDLEDPGRGENGEVGRSGDVDDDSAGRIVTVESSPLSDIAPAAEEDDIADVVRVRWGTWLDEWLDEMDVGRVDGNFSLNGEDARAEVGESLAPLTGGVGERWTGERVGEAVVAIELSTGGFITKPGLMERRLSRVEVTLRPLLGTEREGIGWRFSISSKPTGRDWFLNGIGRWIGLSTEDVRGGRWKAGDWLREGSKASVI
jgi:hypothetical protein